ncbi:MAG: leucine--tRNA ligase [Bacillota bacterium]|nr:leucine--tRNA ligase [Bacillota bacterium]
MDLISIEKKWQKKWKDTRLYAFDRRNAEKKWYVLEMFSYPSGAKLHVGHWYNYGPADTYARFKRMQGYNVFHPMGFDSFGLPAENYAIKSGVHPQDSTMMNIATMKRQLRDMGATFDWDYEINTCMPDYYKWTQWCFLQLYGKGLAYRKEAPVNWCPSCNTVLANEQVISGVCERCKTEVTKKNLTQWFFRITAYAEELLSGLDRIDWPEKTKLMQRNWIGRSEGGEIVFPIKGGGEFTVFTTRADTLFGCTYCVLAPEHPLVKEIVTGEHRAKVEQYVSRTMKESEIDRLSTTREKTGVFTGAYAINPINGREVPIYIADYVLYSYGTGAVMAVPAHDERDFEFAKKYGLPIERVIRSNDGSPDPLPYVDYGVLIGSGKFDAQTSEAACRSIIEELGRSGRGILKVNYRLRDWLISRQRYWGAPIPIVYCKKCGMVPVPEQELPVLLPYDVDFTPDGTSPLAKHEGFMNAVCPSCGGKARRDADTMDTFVCSSWYFLRYPDARNSEKPFDKALIDRILPVDKYIGGAEHACMHLLYARFFVKALRDMGHLSFDEPFLSLVHQGTILGPDGERMSKSRGNVISPDAYIEQYGSDVFRMYLMFGFSYFDGGAWNDDGIKAIYRFLERVQRLIERAGSAGFRSGVDAKKELGYILNMTIKSVASDLDSFSFNTAIARLMELVNALYKHIEGSVTDEYTHHAIKSLVLLLAPFAPHFSEEMWEALGGPYSVFNQSFPICDESALALDRVEVPVQVNGKLRGVVLLPAGCAEEEARNIALADEKIASILSGMQVMKVIIVKDKIVNIIAK